MKKPARLSVIVAAVLSSAALGQSLMGPGPLAVLDGAAMRWLSLAYPEVIRLEVDPSRYAVKVIDDGDKMVVVLSAPTNGSPDGLPGVEIEIAKKDGKVMRTTMPTR